MLEWKTQENIGTPARRRPLKRVGCRLTSLGRIPRSGGAGSERSARRRGNSAIRLRVLVPGGSGWAAARIGSPCQGLPALGRDGSLASSRMSPNTAATRPSCASPASSSIPRRRPSLPMPRAASWRSTALFAVVAGSRGDKIPISCCASSNTLAEAEGRPTAIGRAETPMPPARRRTVPRLAERERVRDARRAFCHRVFRRNPSGGTEAYDALTGLPNRLLFDDRFAHAIRRSACRSAPADVSRPRRFQDRQTTLLGHAVGDDCCGVVSEREGRAAP